MKAYRISVIEVKCGFKIPGDLWKKGEIISFLIQYILYFTKYLLSSCLDSYQALLP